MVEVTAVREVEVVASAFHEEYEHLAPIYGWETNPKSRVPWADVPGLQRALMCHVIGNLMARGAIKIPGVVDRADPNG